MYLYVMYLLLTYMCIVVHSETISEIGRVQ